MGTPSLKWISTIFSLCTSRPFSSFSAATIFRVLTSITSPVDGQACRPSRLNVTQPGCSRSLTLATCLGGITVASKTWTRLLWASQTQSSLSSGVRPTPWLGQPCRLTGPFSKPSTSTRCSFLPVFRSATSKPSRSLTLAKHSVCAALTVNGRTAAANGPTVCTTLCVFVSATDSSGERRPARYMREPSRLTTVLCAPLLVSMVARTSPSVAPTTFQMSFSKEGTYSTLPSGVSDIRSQPCGSAFSQSAFSV